MYDLIVVRRVSLMISIKGIVLLSLKLWNLSAPYNVVVPYFHGRFGDPGDPGDPSTIEAPTPEVE